MVILATKEEKIQTEHVIWPVATEFEKKRDL
jgi:hypothetical protein